jgi:hypothetical protein
LKQSSEVNRSELNKELFDTFCSRFMEIKTNDLRTWKGDSGTYHCHHMGKVEIGAFIDWLEENYTLEAKQ